MQIDITDAGFEIVREALKHRATSYRNMASEPHSISTDLRKSWNDKAKECDDLLWRLEMCRRK